MSLLSSALFNFKGQSVQSVTLEECTHSVLVKCKRDRRCKVVDHYVQRRLSDLPVSGRPCVIEIELAQTRDKLGRRLIEATDFVDKGGRYTKRFCHFISGLCRYMSIHALSKHLDIRWETVKNIDKAFLLSTLPALEPKKLTNLVHIGVDEV
ncbi:helix-turn-helix domain-containing protein, partial [Vibrio sp. 10N.237.312.C02]